MIHSCASSKMPRKPEPEIKEYVNVFVQTDEVEFAPEPEPAVPEKHHVCKCEKCCFHERMNNEEYIYEEDKHNKECICLFPSAGADYLFLVPFVLALSLSVMQFGSIYIDQP
jgi:hypothetical protein